MLRFALNTIKGNFKTVWFIPANFEPSIGVAIKSDGLGGDLRPSGSMAELWWGSGGEVPDKFELLAFLEPQNTRFGKHLVP